MNIRQFITKKIESFRKPCGLVTDHEAHGERRLRWVGDLPSGLHCRFSLRKHDSCVVKKYSACGRQLNAFCSSYKKWRTHLILEVANLAAQRWLRCMQPPFCGKLEASCFGNRDKVTKMPEFQVPPLLKKHNPSAYKAVLLCTSRVYVQGNCPTGSEGIASVANKLPSPLLFDQPSHHHL